jgi:hypothetical protein
VIVDVLADEVDAPRRRRHANLAAAPKRLREIRPWVRQVHPLTISWRWEVAEKMVIDSRYEPS